MTTKADVCDFIDTYYAYFLMQTQQVYHKNNKHVQLPL